MSKTLIVLAILIVIGALAVAYYTSFNPVTSLQTVIQNPSTLLPWISSAVTFIKQNIVGFATGAVGMFALIARSISGYKQQTEQNLNQIKSELDETIIKERDRADVAETKLTETTKTYSENLQSMSKNYVTLQDQLQDATAQTKQLTDERNHLAFELQKKERQLQEYAKRYGTPYVE